MIYITEIPKFLSLYNIAENIVNRPELCEYANQLVNEMQETLPNFEFKSFVEKDLPKYIAEIKSNYAFHCDDGTPRLYFGLFMLKLLELCGEQIITEDIDYTNPIIINLDPFVWKWRKNANSGRFV